MKKYTIEKLLERLVNLSEYLGENYMSISCDYQKYNERIDNIKKIIKKICKKEVNFDVAN